MNSFKNIFFLVFFLYLNRFYDKQTISILGTSTSSATGASSTARLGSEHKKSVTFDDGVRPGTETSPPTSAAATVAANNIMSSHKIRSFENDADQVALFTPGLI